MQVPYPFHTGDIARHHSFEEVFIHLDYFLCHTHYSLSFSFSSFARLHESAALQQFGRRRQQRTAEIALVADGQFFVVPACVGNGGFQYRQFQPLHHHLIDVEYLGIGPAFYLVPEEEDVLQRNFRLVADIVQHGGGERGCSA